MEDILFFQWFTPGNFNFWPPGHVFYPWTSIKLTPWTLQIHPMGMAVFQDFFNTPGQYIFHPLWTVFFSGRAQSLEISFAYSASFSQSLKILFLQLCFWNKCHVAYGYRNVLQPTTWPRVKYYHRETFWELNDVRHIALQKEVSVTNHLYVSF